MAGWPTAQAVCRLGQYRISAAQQQGETAGCGKLPAYSDTHCLAKAGRQAGRPGRTVSAVKQQHSLVENNSLCMYLFIYAWQPVGIGRLLWLVALDWPRPVIPAWLCVWSNHQAASFIKPCGTGRHKQSVVAVTCKSHTNYMTCSSSLLHTLVCPLTTSSYCHVTFESNTKLNHHIKLDSVSHVFSKKLTYFGAYFGTYFIKIM